MPTLTPDERSWVIRALKRSGQKPTEMSGGLAFGDCPGCHEVLNVMHDGRIWCGPEGAGWHSCSPERVLDALSAGTSGLVPLAAKGAPAPSKSPSNRDPSPYPSVTAGSKRPWNDDFLDEHRHGTVQPTPILIPDELPAGTRRVAEFVALVIGLRVAQDDRRPSPFACSWVAAHCECSEKTAHRSLKRLVACGFLVPDDPLEPRPGRRGTATYGIAGYTVPGTARDPYTVPSTARDPSDGAPVASLQSGAVAVEAQDVVARSPVEPAVEAVDQAGVGDAVGRSAAGMLDGVSAVVGRAEDLIPAGHGDEGYEQAATTASARTPTQPDDDAPGWRPAERDIRRCEADR